MTAVGPRVRMRAVSTGRETAPKRGQVQPDYTQTGTGRRVGPDITRWRSFRTTERRGADSLTCMRDTTAAGAPAADALRPSP